MDSLQARLVRAALIEELDALEKEEEVTKEYFEGELRKVANTRAFTYVFEARESALANLKLEQGAIIQLLKQLAMQGK